MYNMWSLIFSFGYIFVRNNIPNKEKRLNGRFKNVFNVTFDCASDGKNPKTVGLQH